VTGLIQYQHDAAQVAQSLATLAVALVVRLRRGLRRISYNWALFHFATTPFGIAVTTILVTHWRDATVRPAITNFDGMTSLVSISAVCYGMSAVAAELGGRTMFWALAQWQKEKDAAKKERLRLNARAKAAGRTAGRAEGIAEGQRQIILAMWNAAQSEDERGHLRHIAEKWGIALPSQ
jgi:hypothetical protein